MKFNRVVKWFLVIGLMAFVMTACAPINQAVQTVVILPERLQVLITALFVFVVGWVFAQIGARRPWFSELFGKYADEIAFTLAGAVIAILQNWLNMIPPAWEEVGNLALALVIAVLSALQVFRLFGKAGVKTFR